ncbi:MAG: RNA methyltransferase, partial [Phycisphaerae bacterium]|nr:RNA methyltransferase [Phycisphaerae bacterium]
LPVVGALASDLATWLREKGCAVIGLSPEADLVYTEADLRQPCALVVGAEDRGLGGTWAAEAAQLVRIPLQGSVDSLNVSVAASVVLYEACRQRSGET